MATGGKKKTGTGKTNTKKSSTKTSAKKSGNKKSSKTQEQPSNSKAGYVLVIMILLIVVLVLLNRYATDENLKKSDPVTPQNIVIDPVKPPAEDKKPDKAEDKIQEKKTAQDLQDKKEDDKEDDKEDKKIVSTRKVKIYLVHFNERTEKTSLQPVFRKVKAGTPVKSALRELIEGPSTSEKNRGLLTAVPRNLKIYSVSITNSTAIIDFNSAIEYGASGSILLNRIDQIIYTATQFENVDSIIIKVNGKLRRFLGSDGIAVSGPLHRR